MGDLELLTDGLDFGEGPRWHDGRLWYSDFYQHAVFTVGADGTRQQELVLDDDKPSGLGWLPDGRLLLVSMDARKVLRREPDGALLEHANLSSVATGPCNDMVVAADGTAYVGNFGSDLFRGEPLQNAALARVTITGEVDVAADDLGFPNGSVITPDGRTLIVGETFGRCYTAFDVADDGSLGGRRQWAAVAGMAPDGCSLDAEGAVWFADATGSQVARVREGGEITHVVDVGQPSFACALGGDDGRTLFILSSDSPVEQTCKGTGKIRTLRVDVPHAGLP